MDVPDFKEEGHPSSWSVDDMNLHSRLLRAFANFKCTVSAITAPKFTLSDGNALLQIPASTSSGSNSGAGFIAFGTLASFSGDFVSITTPHWEGLGANGVVGLVVQKPEELRTSRASEVLFNGTNFITVSYSYIGNGTLRTAHVTASVPNNPGYPDETHTVIPQYIFQGTVNGVMHSSEIVAVSVNGNTWYDANIAGRVWSSVSTDPV